MWWLWRPFIHAAVMTKIQEMRMRMIETSRNVKPRETIVTGGTDVADRSYALDLLVNSGIYSWTRLCM